MPLPELYTLHSVTPNPPLSTLTLDYVWPYIPHPTLISISQNSPPPWFSPPQCVWLNYFSNPPYTLHSLRPSQIHIAKLLPTALDYCKLLPTAPTPPFLFSTTIHPIPHSRVDCIVGLAGITDWTKIGLMYQYIWSLTANNLSAFHKLKYCHWSNNFGIFSSDYLYHNWNRQHKMYFNTIQ